MTHLRTEPAEPGTLTPFCRILGPTEIEINGVPANLGGPRTRRVLTVLSTGAGGPVPDDHLIDQVWRNEPPRNVVQALLAAHRNPPDVGSSDLTSKSTTVTILRIELHPNSPERPKLLRPDRSQQLELLTGIGALGREERQNLGVRLGREQHLTGQMQNTDLGMQEPFSVEAMHRDLVAFPQIAKLRTARAQSVDQVGDIGVTPAPRVGRPQVVDVREGMPRPVLFGETGTQGRFGEPLPHDVAGAVDALARRPPERDLGDRVLPQNFTQVATFCGPETPVPEKFIRKM